MHNISKVEKKLTIFIVIVTLKNDFNSNIFKEIYFTNTMLKNEFCTQKRCVKTYLARTTKKISPHVRELCTQVTKTTIFSWYSKSKSLRAYRSSRSEVCESRALRSVFYVLYIQITKFFPNIFFVCRVVLLKKSFFILNIFHFLKNLKSFCEKRDPI